MNDHHAFSTFETSFTPPSLPQGGGTLRGMGESLSQAGPDGQVSLTIPLPVLAGRGFAPRLALNYHSASGNGPFGLGWGCGTMRIVRRTSHGVPQYNDDDQFLAPDGEVLVRTVGTTNEPNPTLVSEYNGEALSQTWTVTRYQPRIEHYSSRVEFWQGEDGSQFWLLHGSDGTLHMLGKTRAAQICDPVRSEYIAEWLLEESVNPHGEHIWYRYQAENTDNLDLSGNEQGRDHSANRYLIQVMYGNEISSPGLYLWNGDTPSAQWLFALIFDYGERSLDPQTPPTFDTVGTWPARQDPFSSYQYGFETRTHRLCRQVLMFRMQGNRTALISRLLLEYDENPLLTQLIGAQRLAYQQDPTPSDAANNVLEQLPPLDIDYSAPDYRGDKNGWRQMPALPGLNDRPYQLVDLYGEGVPGVLYQDAAAWRYRAPVRGEGGGDDVAYADWQTLAQMPSLGGAASRLMDINGDGHLEWLVAQPALAGFFTQQPDKSWSGFTPFSALPVEFFHPQAQFASLVGSGLADLVLIGPKSVRLYANVGVGFDAGLTVTQDDGVTLPVPGRDARELVAFADVLGSGQSHLIRIRYDAVTCWPNLGRGRFGAPFNLPLPAPLDDAYCFDPARLMLADLDGSGAVDILYAHADRIDVYLNQSGNRLIAGASLPLPDGVVYDRLCQLDVADVSGNGMAELVLSVPHMTPCHWRYRFNSVKPYLLNTLNNNMGAQRSLSWRSSAQEWLDEKQEAPQAIPALPFAVPVLVKSTTLDEITGNTLSQSYRYRQGVYDGQEREFRGFGYLERDDATSDALPTGDNTPLAATQRTKSWYHCGREEDESALAGTPFGADSQAVTLQPTRLTLYQAGEDTELIAPDATTRYWLYRSLKGTCLREETYGLDGSALQDLPYRTMLQRIQARLVQSAATECIVTPLPLEQVNTQYERFSWQSESGQALFDPQVGHQVAMRYDQYGARLNSVNVAYPRRAPLDDSGPTLVNTPADAWQNSYDSQQNVVRYTESLAAVIHLDDAQAWRLNLPSQSRTNLLIGDVLPEAGISYESLAAADGPLAVTQRRDIAHQNEVIYLDSYPANLALIDRQRTVVLNDAALQAYEGMTIPAEYSFELLGYVSVPAVLSVSPENNVWAVEHEKMSYNGSDRFYLPSRYQHTSLSGALTLSYDDNSLYLTQTEDVYLNVTAIEYDDRFLTPCRITDMNGNVQEVQLDALGRVRASSYYGTEQGVARGFGALADNPVSVELAVSAAIAMALTEGYLQQQATIIAIDAFSWMGQADAARFSADERAQLLALRFITADGYIRAKGWRWAQQARSSLALRLAATPRAPVNGVLLSADNYPTTLDPQSGAALQQTQIKVTHSDGFGRALQHCVRVPDGEAWQRTDDGEVVTDPLVSASPRWSVSGRIEYDNKGQPVRQYQPYFLNDWQYVVDASLRTQGYSDTYYYDAPGREIRRVRANGYFRRNGYYPWFSLLEDENDTSPERVTVQGALV
ncbi:SpvB/TcaC N-terminal domain-containing protein [Klebsiella oxytoca]|uniref:SpvB/TcaC N-terminal domain-containing protein n=1 Tax=Klebsiella oxytoca TaxID=571 RepID=UPI00094043A6|nr:SpvB/TcaC N-terminal domain-containing protein [Klebsiella oxytoca]MDM4080610.1 SpvB/TcaC N-terminal domain-containing protein [Klebsiella oxytoca]MDM4097569.1 SpvB/TcaC N-terminal domain-containing protein [Klebsiella oxytoca]MDM4119815.1 SpvB/TcaC N-terminal domain-containing protein [Klebsiella oxytoca]MDM4127729.1 SpvB/TcaC N-terminal domain-containing protein [Klebsiella oxytoca]MDM4134373.1 SpvB/TcaC N-terminal domain-containing protein [Klebsiella oxytoca]